MHMLSDTFSGSQGTLRPAFPLFPYRAAIACGPLQNRCGLAPAFCGVVSNFLHELFHADRIGLLSHVCK
jgi:hypothetical protein